MRFLTALLALAGLPACGEPLVDTEFEGETHYSHRRVLVREVGSYDAAKVASPRFALFWNPGGIHGDPDELVEQPHTSRPLPEDTEPWSLFELPAERMLAETENGGRYGIGRLVVYDDHNGNRERDPDEPLIGDSMEGLLHVPEPLDAEHSPFGRPLPAGTHRVEFPVACGPGPEGMDECGVKLGKECRQSEDCDGPGLCMMGRGRIWAHGVCGLKYDPADPCVPKGGAMFASRDTDDIYFIEACSSDDDCRVDMNEYCDHGIGGCFTGGELALWLGRGGPDALCRAQQLPDPDG